MFHGTGAFSSRELEGFLSLPHGSQVQEDSIEIYLNGVVDSLAAHDYLFAAADSFRVVTRKQKSILNIYLRDGGLSTVSNVLWHGDSLSVPSNVVARALTMPGRTFRWSNLAYDTKLLLDYFETSGYPFARVEIERLEPDTHDKTIEIWLHVKSGPQTRVEFVSFSGNRHSKDRFLQRETRLRSGELYDQRKLDAARRHLTHLDFIRRVDKEKLVVNNDGKTGVRFDLEEAKSTRLDIAAGYQPASENRSGTFSGLANIEFLNLFGVGRRGRIYWNRPNQRIQSVEVSYEEPWVLKQPLSVRLDFNQRIEDTLYVIRKAGLRVKTDLTGNLSIWGAASREETLVDSASEARSGFADNQTTYLETGLSFDTRDHFTNPRGGVYFSSFASRGWRKRQHGFGTARAGSYRLQCGGIDSEANLEFLPFWIASLSLHARALDSDEPEILLPDLYRLGGARTLRGYREEQFLGSRIGWSTAEIRYWLGPASRVQAFLDAGSAYRKQLSVTKTVFKMATGVGLRLETGLGIWGFDYGIGEEDNLLSGKIHVSLLSSF